MNIPTPGSEEGRAEEDTEESRGRWKLSGCRDCVWARKMGWSQWPVLDVGKTVILGRGWESRQKRLASLGPLLPCGRREDLE